MNLRNLKDHFARRLMFLLSIFIIGIAFFMTLGLYLRARPILALHSLIDLIFSSVWHPTQGQFGLNSFIIGTLWVTAIAVIIAVPLSILTAIYLSEYAPKRVRAITDLIVDLLAGISPVIYGVWGVIAIVPLVRDYLMPFLSERCPFFPFSSDNYTGFCILTAGIVLAVMILPIMISIIEEVISSIPREMHEASLSLGATRWQTVKHVLIKIARPGIIAAVILGLSRAFGETMAVLMVAGCSLYGFSRSIFDTAYPLPALIANTYGEMMSVPLYDSAVLLAAFTLLIVTAFFSMLGWGILLRIQNREA